MKIVREKPCQRRHHRVTAPLNVRLPSGQQLCAENWSLGGLRLNGVEGSLPKVGKKLTLRLSLPFQGYDISFKAKAIVRNRHKKVGGIGLEFTKLDERSSDLMKHFIEDLLRGKKATIDDTICRIDVPVTPISTKPDPKTEKGTPVKRLPIKTVAMSALYLALGCGLAVYIALLLYSNFFRVEIRSASTIDKHATIKMPIDGYLENVRVEVGDIVNRGETIARYTNPNLLLQIEELQIEKEQALRELERADQQLAIEAQRAIVLLTIAENEREIARAKLNAQKSYIKVLNDRLSTLLTTTNASDDSEFELKKSIARADAELTTLELELKSKVFAASNAQIAVQSRDGGQNFDNPTVIAKDAALSDLLYINESLNALEIKSNELVLKSPVQGRVISVTNANETVAERFETVATIAVMQPPTIQAYLNQSQSQHVVMDGEANVYLPTIDEHFTATVEGIEHVAGSHLRNGTTNSEAPTTRVSLAFVGDAQLDPRVSGGLPAVVTISKQLARKTNEIFSSSEVGQ